MNNLIREAIRIASLNLDVEKLQHAAEVARNAFQDGGIDCAIVGWLHDVVEDTDVTLEELRLLFPPHIVTAVDCLTRRYENGYPEPYLGVFIPRCASNSIARIVKIADLLHNISRVDGLPVEKRAGMLKRWNKAFEYLHKHYLS